MTDAVVQNSSGGRGFIVGLRSRFVITASHCLPRLPAADPGAYLVERTFQNLLGPLGGTCDVWAECVCVDPVADLAVFAAPNAQAFPAEAGNYGALVAQRTPLRVADLPMERKPTTQPGVDSDAATLDPAEWKGPGRLLALDGQWFDCRLRATGRSLWIEEKAQAFAGGMSGSPIVDLDGAAVGVLCSSGANPLLVRQLPGWLLEEIVPILG